jgi:quercetin dioxygenase-like cupin family protein
VQHLPARTQRGRNRVHRVPGGGHATGAFVRTSHVAPPRLDRHRRRPPRLLGRGLPAVAPGYALLLQRVSHQPGDAVPTHIHPGAEILYVETGTYIYTDFQGDAFVTRGSGATPTAGSATATPPAAEQVPVGTEILLQAGDSLFQDRGVVHALRVMGDAPASQLLSRLFATDQPAFTYTNTAGTPTP